MQRKTEELSDILHQNNIHMACQQETKLNPNLTLRIKGYTTIRKDRSDRSCGRLAFLIKQQDIKYKICPGIANRNSDSNAEAQAIDIFLHQNSLRIVNVYHPDNTEINVDLLHDLVNTTNGTKIMLGDFNAKSPSGEVLLYSRRALKLKIYSSTYTSQFLTIIKLLTSQKPMAPRQLLTSLQLTTNMNNLPLEMFFTVKADWPKFTSKLEEFYEIIKPSSLNNMVPSFNSFVQKSLKLSIPRGKKKTNWVPYWKDNHIEELISERDALCAEVQSNNTEDNRRKYANSCQKVEEEISLCKRQKWKDFCATLDPRKTSQHWNIIKTLNNRVSQPPQDAQETNSINHREKLAYTNSEVSIC
ncbi:hypothetical protein HNY73_006478 [Argiope bruennichi]|uniref:Endonuclease/exonuclease/phosphatase domain-containing protein n=1 Tax=Argiope bruennichi TaxID=94029 RepID=A0A8T0FK72_ARGBR|nr:hypothetical protein HNY73_006478 [Argiope bruennichi]